MKLSKSLSTVMALGISLLAMSANAQIDRVRLTCVDASGTSRTEFVEYVRIDQGHVKGYKRDSLSPDKQKLVLAGTQCNVYPVSSNQY